MARVYTIPSGPAVGADGQLRPEWRVFLQRLAGALNAVAAVPVLDGGTTYSADELRDAVIAVQVALGAE